MDIANSQIWLALWIRHRYLWCLTRPVGRFQKQTHLKLLCWLPSKTSCFTQEFQLTFQGTRPPDKMLQRRDDNETQPSDVLLYVRGPELIGFSLSMMLFGIFLILSINYLSATYKVFVQLKAAPIVTTSYNMFQPSKVQTNSLISLVRRLSNPFFTVLGLQIIALTQIVIHFLLFWKPVVVHGPMMDPPDPSLFETRGLILASSLITVVIQAVVQIALLARAKKLNHIATYSVFLWKVVPRPGLDKLRQTESITNMSVAADGDSQDDDARGFENVPTLFQRRRIMNIRNKIRSVAARSNWLWMVMAILEGLGTAAGLVSACIEYKAQGQLIVSDDLKSAASISTPIWYCHSIFLDLLIGASTARDLLSIIKHMLGTDSCVSSLRSLARATCIAAVCLSIVQITLTVLHFTFQVSTWKQIPLCILPRVYEIILIAVLTTSHKSQETQDIYKSSQSTLYDRASRVFSLQVVLSDNDWNLARPMPTRGSPRLKQ
ncbi:hypothetical protein CROQUDRAFT_671346 [Cronartium quercuum f. sp. fusiforme G11]|uniref:Uncharacterized protein n=1 Tax=Cronartium quercuum f. sp. fusiforme G11 TaxID=708437 RepID=A0A9P6TBD8_9BASI|nr:hypothetical protein CROQUDRAFT_671346 [Cronartium quercuum f. sp. fusiforme G11]